MSVFKERNFILFLIETNSKQFNIVLNSITNSQVRAICELILNLRHLPITPRVEREVEKRKEIFLKLISKKLNIIQKKKILQKNRTKIFTLFHLVKKQLQRMLI